MIGFLLVGLGGAFGAISRYSMGLLLNHHLGSFPIATFICNILGSLLIGIVTALLVKNYILGDYSMYIKALVVTGFLGGFTTFSSFSLDFMTLIQSCEYLYALIYSFLSIVLSFAFVFIGFYIINKIL